MKNTGCRILSPGGETLSCKKIFNPRPAQALLRPDVLLDVGFREVA